MANITNKPNVDLVFTFTINEGEARALDALVGYGFDAFIKVFKENLGSHYMEGYEKDLKAFFEDIRENVPSVLQRLDLARKTFNQ